MKRIKKARKNPTSGSKIASRIMPISFISISIPWEKKKTLSFFPGLIN
jgi:hypothetical protein